MIRLEQNGLIYYWDSGGATSTGQPVIINQWYRIQIDAIGTLFNLNITKDTGANVYSVTGRTGKGYNDGAEKVRVGSPESGAYGYWDTSFVTKYNENKPTSLTGSEETAPEEEPEAGNCWGEDSTKLYVPSGCRYYTSVKEYIG